MALPYLLLEAIGQGSTALGGTWSQRMSALGHKATCAPQKIMSALPPKADMCLAVAYVCFGPIADIPQLPKWKDHLAVVSPKCVQMCVSRVGKTVARITSSLHFLGLLKEAIGYPREILLCRGIRR